MEPGKGYSILMRRPAVCPAGPLALAEARVAVTPWKEKLRLAGTLELAGLDLSINRRRVDAILRAGGQYLKNFRAADIEEAWAGLRPLSFDGLPIIGRSSHYENLYLATGHGMLGMTGAAATAHLITNLVMKEKPCIDPAPFSPARCGG